MSTHWTLTVLDKKGTPDRVLSLVAPSCHVGRDPGNELQLDLESVSGRHARLSLDPDGDWWMEDLNSTNGIWKDDEQIKGMHRILDGEVLEIGVVKVRFDRVDDEPEEPERPSPAPDQSHRIRIDDETDQADMGDEGTAEPFVIQAPGDSLRLDWDEEEEEGKSEGQGGEVRGERAEGKNRVQREEVRGEREEGKNRVQREEVRGEREEVREERAEGGGQKEEVRGQVEAGTDQEPEEDSSSEDSDPPRTFDPTEPEKTDPKPVPTPEPEPDPEKELTPEPEPAFSAVSDVSDPQPVHRASTPAEKLQRALDASLRCMGKVHAFLAKWLPVLIGWCVETFCLLPIPARFTVGFLFMAVTAAWSGWVSLPRYFIKLDLSDEYMQVLAREGLVEVHGRLIQMIRYLVPLCLGAAAWAWVRRKRVLVVFKAVLALQTLFWIYVFSFFTRVPSVLNSFDHKGYTKYLRNEHWLQGWVPWLFVMVVPLLLMLGTALRSVHRVYLRREKEAEPLLGDQVVENLRTGGEDPRMRSSTYWSAFLFFSVIAVPLLMTTCGWEEPYGIPKGSGEPVVEMVQVKKKKKPPEKRLIVNNWSPYIFERMKIDDIQVLEDLEEQSMDTYEIVQEKSGKLGKGGGKKGGWPEGMEGATVRFIRLEYRGGDWKQDMGKGSDYNLLIRFHQITGFPIAQETESRKVNRLKLFPKGRKPPFVYMTGKSGVNFSSDEIKTLRWYTLEEGGMLFIDHGGGGFGRSIEGVLRRIFPGQRLVDIPNDDPVFRAPFVFPSGAPPLWQHGGTRARGIRHNGRWVVFYHPGDMGDAWKDGHSGVAPEIAEQAYRMGINVMYYAFNQYYALHFE